MAWNLFQEGEKLWLMKVKFPTRNHDNTTSMSIQCTVAKKTMHFGASLGWKIDAQIGASRCISWQSDSFLIICHIQAFLSINCKVFTNIQTARSTSCLLFLHSEILNISTSPHEFKMDSHISVAFPKAVSVFSEEGTQQPSERSLLQPDSVDVCVPFKCSWANNPSWHYSLSLCKSKHSCFLNTFSNLTSVPVFVTHLRINPRNVIYGKTVKIFWSQSIN